MYYQSIYVTVEPKCVVTDDNVRDMRNIDDSSLDEVFVLQLEEDRKLILLNQTFCFWILSS